MAMHLWGVTEANATQAHPGERSESVGYAAGLLTWMIAGSVFVAVKLVETEMPPWTLCFFRVFITALVMLPFLAPHHARMWTFFKENWLHALFIGAIGLGLTQGVLFTALHMTTAVNASICFGMAPMITHIMARLFLGEPMTAVQGLGSLVAFCGIIVISVQGSFANLAGLKIGLGEAVALGAAALFASYTVLLKKAKFELPALPLLAILLWGGAISTFPFFIWEYLGGKHSNLTTNGYLAVLYCAVVGGAVMYFCYNTSIEILGAARAGTMNYTQMIFVAIFAWILLGERLEWYHYVGAAFVAAGVFLVLTNRPKPTAHPG